jgi:hypothetical protein
MAVSRDYHDVMFLYKDITIAHSICHHISPFNLLKRLAIEPCDSYYNRRILEVDMYYLARSGVDIMETGWNLSLEKRM